MAIYFCSDGRLTDLVGEKYWKYTIYRERINIFKRDHNYREQRPELQREVPVNQYEMRYLFWAKRR